MRITRSLGMLSLAGVLAIMFTMATGAGAQDTKSDPETVSPKAAQQFGPRKKAPQQQQQANAPKVETIATHGSWQVQCTEIAGADGTPSKACGMIQQSKSEKNKNINLSVIVSKVKNGDKTVVFMRILAPIGVYLPTGIPVEIDGTALPNRMQFTRCTRFCEAFGEASPESLAKFRKGTAATYYLYDRPGNGFPMKVSLEGFDAALKELDQL